MFEVIIREVPISIITEKFPRKYPGILEVGVLFLLLSVELIPKVEANTGMFHAFHGYALNVIEGATKQLVTHYAEKVNKFRCIHLCSEDALCSGVQYQPAFQHCDLNRYARMLLTANSTSNVYAKSMNFTFSTYFCI